MFRELEEGDKFRVADQNDRPQENGEVYEKIDQACYIKKGEKERQVNARFRGNYLGEYWQTIYVFMKSNQKVFMV